MKVSGRIVHLVIFSCSLFIGCSTRSPAPPLPSEKRGHGVYHIVRSGETMFRIGKAYDVPFEEIARLNGIKNPDQIRIGQAIFIPEANRQLPVTTITPAETLHAPPSSAKVRELTDVSLVMPVSGTINSGFGPRGASFHDGIDIAAPEGTPIRAVEHGEVLYSDQLRGYGNIVIILHQGGLVTVYAHNQANLVREGQQVARGQVIAKVGSTGRVTGPHLHFEIRKNNTAQDPLFYLPRLCCFPSSGMVSPKG
jgi:murein DD-endopeptidase MepM/ murein hydrolase activator NlpD